jgi:hypothetical protein
MGSSTQWAGAIAAATVGGALWYMRGGGSPSEVELLPAGPDPDAPRFLVVNLPDKHIAVKKLGDVARDLGRVVAAMQAKDPTDPDVQQLVRRFRPEAISEGTHNSGYTSFSVNKGERIVLCIRNTNGSFVDHNVIMYVALHELAHIMTPEVGHTQAFWSNFTKILRCAMDLGVYHKVDYAKHPTPYCGITIRQSVV